MLLVYVLGFYEGSFFDRWLHRPITITLGHRSADHMERVCRTRRERVSGMTARTAVKGRDGIGTLHFNCVNQLGAFAM